MLKNEFSFLVACIMMTAFICDVGVSVSSFEYDGQSNKEPFNLSQIPADTTDITVKNFPLNRLVHGSFSNFIHCRTLTLEKTNISIVELGAFDGLSQLVTLNLENNNIQTVQPYLFENLTNLEILNLRYNGVNTLNSDSFNGLVSLKSLDLHWHTLETLGADWFDKLLSLTDLRLHGIDTKPILKGLKPYQFRTLNKTE